MHPYESKLEMFEKRVDGGRGLTAYEMGELKAIEFGTDPARSRAVGGQPAPVLSERAKHVAERSRKLAEKKAKKAKKADEL